MEVDFLLIGQGLAGTVLSYRLINSGRRVHVIDQASNNHCSRVAAGLYNPLTGRKMVKTWNADEIFPEIEPFYAQLEKELDIKVVYPRDTYRPFLSIEEQNDWMGLSGGGEYQNYIKCVKTTSAYAEMNDHHGGLVLGQSGYVDLNTLMDHYAIWLEKQDRLTNEEFDENELKISNARIKYKHIKATTLIYCNGMGAINSRFFSWVPLKPNKGEILVIKQNFAPEEIINRGIFRITLPNKDFKVGSTYNFKEFDLLPTEEGKKELLEKLKKLIPLPVQGIVEHKTGIRPTTMDRKPILGKHPEYGNVYIFNGLGAKGVSLAPYFSKIMLDFLLFKKEPHKEVNISRFFDYI